MGPLMGLNLQAARDRRWPAPGDDHLRWSLHVRCHCVSNPPAVQATALAGKNEVNGIALVGEDHHVTGPIITVRPSKMDSLPD